MEQIKSKIDICILIVCLPENLPESQNIFPMMET